MVLCSCRGSDMLSNLLKGISPFIYFVTVKPHMMDYVWNEQWGQYSVGAGRTSLFVRRGSGEDQWSNTAVIWNKNKKVSLARTVELPHTPHILLCSDITSSLHLPHLASSQYKFWAFQSTSILLGCLMSVFATFCLTYSHIQLPDYCRLLFTLSYYWPVSSRQCSSWCLQ